MSVVETARADRHVSRVVAATDRGPNDQTQRTNIVLDFGHWEEFDPFLGMAEDWAGVGAFPDHPHRGFETVSVVIDGHLRHRDSKGHEGILRPGDVQWVTAGRGVVHSEEAAEEGGVHFLQLWLNLAAADKLTEARYQEFQAGEVPTLTATGVVARVHAGEVFGLRGPALTYVPTELVDLELNSAAVSVDLPGDHFGFAYVIEGEAQVAGHVVPRWHSALLPSIGEGPSTVAISTQHEARVLVFAGLPLNEPVVAAGPFVMNTEEEVHQAFVDWKAGVLA